jgi:hypothetical protein
MKRVKLIATAMALAVLAMLAGNVTAQQVNTNERTFLTFSGAVEMPGVTLQPGTYVFKLADTPARNVVQVWDEREKDILGQWTFVQAERPRVTEDTVVMFRETREGAMPAVQYWYFPGEKIGKEFIYPKDQAERIAARTGATVRTEDGIIQAPGISAAVEVTESPAAADVAIRNAPAASQPTAAAGSLAGSRQPAAEPEPIAVQPAPVAAGPAPEPEPAVVAAAPPEPAPVVEERRPVAANDQSVGTSGQADVLPSTASPLALSGLLGLFSLVGAAGIRLFRD